MGYKLQILLNYFLDAQSILPHTGNKQSHPQTLRTMTFRKIGEGKMEGGSGKWAYYLVKLNWNVSGAN